MEKVVMIKPIRCKRKGKYYGNESGDRDINELPENVKLDLIEKKFLKFEAKPKTEKKTKGVKDGTNA